MPRLTVYLTLVQSACCHPDWTAQDHAMYLWTEHYFRDGSMVNPEFYDLQDWCQNRLISENFEKDVASALDSAG